MKKVFILSVCLLFASCKKEDPKMTQIEKSISEGAFGADIGYKAGQLTEVKTFTVGDFLDTFGKQTEEYYKTPDSAASAYVTYAEQLKEQNNIDNYWIAVGRTKMFNELKGKKAEDIAYKVYKYQYKINNLLDEKSKSKRDVSYYFIFDGKDSLVAKDSEDDVKMYKKELINVPDFTYILLINKKYAEPQ